jgi:hypothetical protein
LGGIKEKRERVQPDGDNGAVQQDMEAAGQRLKMLEEAEVSLFTLHETIPNHLENKTIPVTLRWI